MAIKVPSLSTVPSDDYANLNTDVKTSILGNEFIYGKVKGYFDSTYMPASKMFSEAYKKPIRSLLTVKIDSQRLVRIKNFRIFRQTIKLRTKKSGDNYEEASNKINILLQGYEDIASKSMNAQTGLIDDLLLELDGNYKVYVEVLKVEEEVEDIRNANVELKRLISAREDEYMKKSKATITESRKKLDPAIRTVCSMIDAFAISEGNPEYQEFTDRINIIFKRYGNKNYTPAAKSDKTDKNHSEEIAVEVNLEEKYADASEWRNDFGVANAKAGMIFYTIVDGKKQFYKLIDLYKISYEPDSEKDVGVWERLLS